MGEPLNILLVEDSEDDALLILLELRRNRFEPNWQRVETPRAFSQALETLTWDVILADYHLPCFDALTALNMVRSRRLDMPFIVVSGTIGERSAVAMMKAGVHDYVMKNNLARLPEAIRRELRDASSRTERRRMQTALRESQERLRLVTENMRDLVCLHHPDGQYAYVTPSIQSLLGYGVDEVVGSYPDRWLHPEDIHLLESASCRLPLACLNSPVTYRMRHKNGSYIWVETLGKAVLSDTGQLIHYQTTSRDVEQRMCIEHRLKYEATHDHLTGLANRTLLIEQLDIAIRRYKQQANSQFALLFLDLDNFKVVNDSLGHLTGDELLIHIASQLLQLTSDDDLVARLGGDEFVILQQRSGQDINPEHLAKQITTLLSSPVHLPSCDLFVSTSIGIVTGNREYQRADELLRDADLAMYRAKKNGRGSYMTFESSMRLRVVKRLHLENDLRQALIQENFVLHYQPIIDLKSTQIYGFEALVRWEHPQRGLILPNAFIPVAEEMGLIVPLGKLILRMACKQLALWQTQFPERVPKISVNLSVKQLQLIFLEQLDEILSDHHLKRNSLTLEITESMLVENIESTCSLLNAIKAKNISLTIDDFGTGYSSLSYLQKLPVRALKIDRNFISSENDEGTRSRVIAESLIALSDVLGLHAIAEGIETQAQLRWLQAVGCELGQGYLFSPPVTASRATRMLSQLPFTDVVLQT